jgi:hypothetical protein
MDRCRVVCDQMIQDLHSLNNYNEVIVLNLCYLWLYIWSGFMYQIIDRAIESLYLSTCVADLKELNGHLENLSGKLIPDGSTVNIICIGENNWILLDLNESQHLSVKGSSWETFKPISLIK